VRSDSGGNGIRRIAHKSFNFSGQNLGKPASSLTKLWQSARSTLGRAEIPTGAPSFAPGASIHARTERARAIGWGWSRWRNSCRRGRTQLSIIALSGIAIYGSLAAVSQDLSEDRNPATHSTQSFEQLAERAQAAADADRLPEAVRLYQDAVALRPSWSEGWWNLGTILFDSKQFTRARDAFRHFVSVEHQQPGPGFGMLGLAEFELKDYHGALEALERGRELGLGDNPAFLTKVFYVDGILNTLFAQPEIALVRLTRAANQLAAQHPEAPKDAVLGETKLLDAFGLAALRIQQLPEEIPAQRAAIVRQAGHAQALIALQYLVPAGQEIKQLVDQNPSTPGVHYMYGVYLLAENPESAIAEFRREIEISPQNVPARIQLALEFLRTSDYQNGLPYARQAVALAPNNFVAHVACGRLWLGLGKTDRALTELRIAVRLSPGSPDAHFALSRALTDAGLSREAARERAEFERLKAISNANDRR
jgi:tetratricopeptide (TPR) repeat protein